MSEVWIDTAYERALRLGEGAAPDLLAEIPVDPDPEEPDPRAAWLTRLGEAFPPGPAGQPVHDWAGVSRRLTQPTSGEHRIETAHTRQRALARLATEVADGWAPVMLVDLRSGEGWRAGSPTTPTGCCAGSGGPRPPRRAPRARRRRSQPPTAAPGARVR